MQAWIKLVLHKQIKVKGLRIDNALIHFDH